MDGALAGNGRVDTYQSSTARFCFLYRCTFSVTYSAQRLLLVKVGGLRTDITR